MKLVSQFRDNLHKIILFLIIALWLSWAVSVYFINEDAFISFRYVQNLVSGDGLVYNPGVQDEGYSNLLWILLISPFSVLGIPPEGVAPVLGILSGVLLLYVVWLLGKRFFPDKRWLPLAAPGFVAVAYPIICWAGSGLETVPFALLLITAAYFHLRERPTRFPWTGLFLGLAALTRPEGLGFIPVFIVHQLYCRWRKANTGSDWRDLLPALGLVAAQFIFRRFYYGMWWSLPAIVKVGGTFLQLKGGLVYLFQWIFLRPPLLLFALGLYGLIRRWKRADATFFAMLLAGQAVFIIYAGGDYMGHFRFLVAALAPLVLLAILGLGEVSGKLRSNWRIAVPMVTAVAVLWNLALSIGPTLDRWGRPSDQLHQSGKVMSGMWLRDALPPGTWIASGSAGALPYFAGLPSIDFAGLCNAEAACEGERRIEGMVGHYIAHPDLVIRERPWVVVINPNASSGRNVEAWLTGEYAAPGYTFERLSFPNRAMLAHPRFGELYQPMLVQTAPDLYFTFYALRGEAVELCRDAGARTVSPSVPKGMSKYDGVDTS